MALRFPETVEDHPWGHDVYKVRGRMFLMLSEHQGSHYVTLKLPVSFEFALEYPFAAPAGYGLGKARWVASTFTTGMDVPLDVFEAWVDESFRAVAPEEAAEGPRSGTLTSPCSGLPRARGPPTLCRRTGLRAAGGNRCRWPLSSSTRRSPPSPTSTGSSTDARARRASSSLSPIRSGSPSASASSSSPTRARRTRRSTSRRARCWISAHGASPIDIPPNRSHITPVSVARRHVFAERRIISFCRHVRTRTNAK
ncbi:MAG: MmcQ/YjbR family DNA-binding protein [Bauldia sp.]|nr:MmcQ/YjbR family DNA-binding protein [Bauldia sp.]